MDRLKMYSETRTRYAELINRQLELEILIRKNANDPVSLSALRQEYREVTSEVQNILINNILIATENGIN